MKITPIIGLEVHVELKTNSKMFCSCSASHFHIDPNTHTCPICLGLLGTLPVPNKTAIDWCIKLGLALNCDINEESFFERKHYFYPDLPKGYQITQLQKPIAINGYLEIDNQKIRINRAHMEEDAGKSIHQKDKTLLDFNRAGVPLIEIVSEPDLNSPEITKKYLMRIQQIIRYIGISDADIEKGSMRCEPTINLKIEEKNQTFYTPLAEIKNIAGLSGVLDAINYEIERQTDEFKKTGEEKSKENKTTRGWDADNKKSYQLRQKVSAADYRYFPEPDIPPFEFSLEKIETIKKEIPELPDGKIKKYLSWGILNVDAESIVADQNFALCFEKAVDKNIKYAKQISNLFLGPLKLDLDIAKIKPEYFKDLIESLDKKEISSTVAKQIVLESYQLDKNPLDIAKEQNLLQVSDTGELEKYAKEVIANNQKAVDDYHKNPNSIGFLLGQVMKASGGSANPTMVKEILERLLK
jgi:aspartyl-tRNA(Asn)/glutamyl-tRNA(Gln) amidotransferase subunit B